RPGILAPPYRSVPRISPAVEDGRGVRGVAAGLGGWSARPERIPGPAGRLDHGRPARAGLAIGGAGELRAMTARQLMVVAAAREIRDGEVVFVGMRLPLLGFALAKATHAPNAIGLFENGVIRDRPPDGFIYTMADPPNIVNAAACLGLLRGGPATLITTLGVFDVTPDGLRVRTRHPGISVDAIRAATGFPIAVPTNVSETVPPTEAELGHIRRADPNGFWTGEN